ncbi:MAG: class I SAM-dependent methyltransferase family protein [Candidatus Bathyarchaeota archaeon]|nr:class I SAM-dependent methyltransferase family protein [Candidatus Bathyarchaeota archaeon]
MRKKLKHSLSQTGGTEKTFCVYNSFDIIGDLAITKLPDNSSANAQAVAEAIMNRHRNVKAVFAQESAVVGEYRLRRLTCLKGENRTCAVHKESGCLFSVDVGSCYFSPRLSGERLRIAQLVQPNEAVINMFAGVGCFSILIAKHVPSAKVYSIDINPEAFVFMQKNIQVNRVYGKVTPILGDAKKVIETSLQGWADRVLMPLPEKAVAYLPAAVAALKPSGGWIHVHLFEHASKNQNPADKAKQKVADALAPLGLSFDVTFVRKVRSTGPNWCQLVLDVFIRRFDSLR